MSPPLNYYLNILEHNMSRLYDRLTVTDRLDKKCQLKTRFQKVLIKESSFFVNMLPFRSITVENHFGRSFGRF